MHRRALNLPEIAAAHAAAALHADQVSSTKPPLPIQIRVQLIGHIFLIMYYLTTSLACSYCPPYVAAV